MDKRKLLLGMIIILISSTLISTPLESMLVEEPILNLVLYTKTRSIDLEMLLHLAQDLRELGIEIEITMEEGGDWLFPPRFDNYDLGMFRIFMKGEPDFSYLYDIPFWCGYDLEEYNFTYKEELLDMINVGPTIKSETERKEHYFKLQELMMDKILMYLPIPTTKTSIGLWNNTMGFNESWGLVESLPYMSYTGFHHEQQSLDKLMMAEYNWCELNPILFDDYDPSLPYDEYPGTNYRLVSFLNEPLLKLDPSGNPTQNGLIEDWTNVNETHYKFFLNTNTYWNPSYNSSYRTANSPSLNSSDVSQLMIGLQGEYSNGINQPLTAKDAVFSLLSYANPLVSEYSHRYYWMKDVYVDEANPFAFHLVVDGNPNTTEQDYYSLTLQKLNQFCLPEFFLNSTDAFISNTTSGIECIGLYPEIEYTPEWYGYGYSGFGVGKYVLDYAVENSVNVLRRSPYWSGKGAIDGQEGLTPFVDTIIQFIIPDNSAALLEFKSGNLDYVVLDKMPEQRNLMEENLTFQVFTKESDYIDIIAFNLNHDGLGGTWDEIELETPGYENYTKALAMRKAIAYSLTREETGKDYLIDFDLSDCPIPETMNEWYYEDISQRYEYNLSKSVEWLTAAGFNISIPTSSTPTNSTTSISNFTVLVSVTIIGVMMRRLFKRSKK